MPVEYKPVAEIRRENLERVISDVFGGVALRLAEAIGVAPPHIARVRKSGKWSQNIGDQMARNVEVAARLPEGWLDHQHDDMEELYDQIKSLDEKRQAMVRTIVQGLLSEG